MEYLYHSAMLTSVFRTMQSEVLAQSRLVSTEYEAVAELAIDTSDLTVKRSGWEIFRSPASGMNGCGSEDGLIGQEMGFQSGRALGTIGNKFDGIPKLLLTECVKGMIQSDVFLFRERGFPSVEDYQHDWKKQHADSCFLYSNQHRSQNRPWTYYFDARKYDTQLFSRSKTAQVTKTDEYTYSVSGGFFDGYHEIGIELTTADGLVSRIEGGFMRSPDPLCAETIAGIQQLAGRKLDDLNKHCLSKIVGGTQGCYHLVEFLSFLTDALTSATKLKA